MGFFPPMTDERRQLLRQQENQRRDVEDFRADHVCKVCDSLLGSRRDRDGGWEPFCMADPEHEGFERLMGQAERYRRGLPVSPYVAQALEKRGVKRMTGTDLAKLDEKGMLARVEMARFPEQLSAADKRLLVKVALNYGLDPLLGELLIYQGHAFVSIDGRYRKARETGELDGVETRPATGQERRDWQIPAEDYFFRCEVWRKDASRPFVGWGRVRAGETKAPASGKAGFRPLETNPQRMAEKRAEAQALRKAFGLPLPTFGGDAAAPEILEVDHETGEVVQVGPGLPRPDEPSPPTEVPLAAPKLTCVNDILKAAHERYGLQPKQVYEILGVKSSVDVTDLGEAWAKVVAQEG